MNRKDFRDLALIRFREAATLLNDGKFDGAYYVSGYIVECGLKACIARRTRQNDFPPPRKLVDQCYSHDFGALIVAAGLEMQLQAELLADPVFARNWTAAKGWSEQARYQRWTQQQARDIVRAIADRKHGVLRWLRRHW